MADNKFKFVTRVGGVSMAVTATMLHLCPVVPYEKPAMAIEHVPHEHRAPVQRNDLRFAAVNSTTSGVGVWSSAASSISSFRAG
jgi:hypothetical protein